MTEAGPKRSGRLSLTIDQVGNYLGVGGGGERRFSSSRKTVNGPGGASLLDGSGTYARTLRTVRRIRTR